VIPLVFYCHKAGGYQIFEHATWDGLPIADWFFPWFLWIMGVCVPIGVKNSLERAQSRWQNMKSIILVWAKINLKVKILHQICFLAFVGIVCAWNSDQLRVIWRVGLRVFPLCQRAAAFCIHVFAQRRSLRLPVAARRLKDRGNFCWLAGAVATVDGAPCAAGCYPWPRLFPSRSRMSHVKDHASNILIIVKKISHFGKAPCLKMEVNNWQIKKKT
jgi:hypothetical protein